MYFVFGLTVTVCEHWAVSELLGEPCSAFVPEWTGLEATDAVPVQVHGDSEPVSKPPFTIAPLPGGCDEALEDGDELGEDDGDDDAEEDGELEPVGPQTPLSVHTPCELLPGMSPWVHHLAVQVWPP